MAVVAPAPYASPVLTDTMPTSDGLRTKVVAWIVRLIMSKVWLQWLRTLTDAINMSSISLSTISISAQHASIAAATALTVPSTGMYRINWYIQITTVGSVSSSIGIDIQWVSQGTSFSLPGTPDTSNSLSTYLSGSQVVAADVDTVIAYTVNYLSTAADSMKYMLIVAVERVG